MITTFKVILLITMIITLTGTIGEKKDKYLLANMMIIFLFSTVAFIVTIILF